MIVLDLSRDDELLALLLGESVTVSTVSTVGEVLDRTRLRIALQGTLADLGICHSSLSAGTNYSRGDETVLATLFTRCATEGEGFFATPALRATISW